jgi:hypothetical protein
MATEVTPESETRRSAEAGAAQFPGWNSRRFNYYKPLGKRDLRQYQDVTVDVQPDPNRYLLQSWIISFAMARPRITSGGPGSRAVTGTSSATPTASGSAPFTCASRRSKSTWP